MRIAICDDNEIICHEVERLILNYADERSVYINTIAFTSGEELLQSMETIESTNKFDLIFLDIELGTTTGINVGNKIRNELDDHISKIIFITSKTGYEKQLFDVQPFNFLQKPIDKAKLNACLDLATKLLKQEQKQFEYKIGYDAFKIKYEQILYFEAKARKIRIVTIDSEDIFYGVFKELQVGLPKTFVLTHKSFLANINNSKQISSKYMIMLNNDEIPISKSNIAQVRKMLLQVESSHFS